MLPSPISQLVVLLKGSSLRFIVGCPDLLRTMELSYSSFGDGYRLPLFLVTPLICLAVNITHSHLAVYLGRRLSSRR